MKKIFLSLLLIITAGYIAAQTYNVKDYGAAGNGKQIDSPAIQKAIDDCTNKGGGTVIIPKGTYLSATVVIKDNVTLHLQEGALLLGSTDLNDYTMVDPFTDGLGVNVGRTFIAAVDARNIAIEGKGTIDGQGSALKARHIETDTRPEGKRWGERPFLLRIVRCKNVRVQDITLKYSASWTSHYAQSSDIVIDNVKITSLGVAHNDGIDIDGCQRVKITNCDVESGDDALCFKTTHSKYPCRDIVVDNIKLKSNQAGIKTGTESMAAFENIKITNCYIYNTNNGGIKLFTVDGAHLKNIVIENVKMDNVRTPMLFRLGSRLNIFRKGQDEQQPTGIFENVVIRNVQAKSAEKTQLTSASGILITGVPGHYIKGLTLENIEIELPGGGTVAEGRHEVPEAVKEYPEVKTFGPTIPAYGIWARHAEGLILKDITFRVNKADQRPLCIFEDIKNSSATGIQAELFAGSESAIRFKDVKNMQFGVAGLTGTSTSLAEVVGTGNSKIVLKGTTTLKSQQKVKAADGAKTIAISFTE